MIMFSQDYSKLIVLPLLLIVNFSLVYATSCEYGIRKGNKLYSYSLNSPLQNFPHGVLSEDGFYKVAANDTIIWFQLCDGLIFNHDPPRCVDCWDCGGPSRCGMGCSALVAKYISGYNVCTAVGRAMNFDINLIGAKVAIAPAQIIEALLKNKKAPDKGVTIMMSSNTNGDNCSLSVSVVCDSNSVKATELRHPSGCPKVSVRGAGWGWFGVLLTILLCTVGAYLLIGAVYRFFYLGIRGLHVCLVINLFTNLDDVLRFCDHSVCLLSLTYAQVIPSLDFWMRIPHSIKSVIMSVVQRFRGPTYHHRSSYSPVNF
ncbi:Bifunctional glutamine synthetase adenylyltransferase/adenylyl-removing enzyme [Bienertia sinuspersici]